jgi:DNA-binding transcriptional LysR family regulator
MRFKKLDLNLLVALDHLLHLRSVTAAASRLNITQSAMSNALSRLRAYFDDELLVKVGRGLELTPRAEALKGAVRDVLVRVDWTIATASEFDPASADRQFNILASDYTLATLAPEAMRRARELSHTISFNFLHQYDTPEHLLNRGDVDLVIIPSDFCARAHPHEVLYEEEFRAIVWALSPLAKRRITRREFSQAAHVVMQPPGNAQSLETVYFKRQEVVRRADVTTYSFNTIPLLVVGTDRIATIHGRLARQAEKLLPIKIVDIPFRLPRMKQTMQWHKHRTQDAALIWLRNLFREAAEATSDV